MDYFPNTNDYKTDQELTTEQKEEARRQAEFVDKLEQTILQQRRIERFLKAEQDDPSVTEDNVVYTDFNLLKEHIELSNSTEPRPVNEFVKISYDWTMRVWNVVKQNRGKIKKGGSIQNHMYSLLNACKFIESTLIQQQGENAVKSLMNDVHKGHHVEEEDPKNPPESGPMFDRTSDPYFGFPNIRPSKS